MQDYAKLTTNKNLTGGGDNNSPLKTQESKENPHPKNPYDSNCTTNQSSNTLLNQFKDSLNSDIEHLAFLMGYFRISGFLRLHDILKSKGYTKLTSIRLLVGLNVDKLIYDLQAANLDPNMQEKPFKELFYQTQKGIINTEGSYTMAVDDSISTLSSVIKSGQIQIRIVREKNAHAKFYLFYKQQHSSSKGRDECVGSLIVGSSNLSHNGLEQNYEFNLKTTDSRDLDFAKWEFERLWENALPLSALDIAQATKDTYLQTISPRELYYKLLLCYFGDGFLHQDASIEALFKGYTTYQYQIDAVQEGIEKLQKYNGFFLSDVVGLGKTLIACVIAKKLQIDSKITGKILFISPRQVKTSWLRHIDDIAIANYIIKTRDDLHNISKDDIDQIELVVCDESHRFRTSDTKKYENLQNIIKSSSTHKPKKLILLSATPQNNHPQELANQIYLFRDRKDTQLLDGKVLESFLTNIAKDFKSLQQKRKEIYDSTPDDKLDSSQALQENRTKLKELGDKLRDTLLLRIMIRRTRSDIEAFYQDDKTKQNLSFPEITPPKDLTYNLDEISHNLASDTIKFLDQSEQSSLGRYQYKRYLLFPNLTEQGQEKYMQAYGKKHDKSYYDTSAKQLQGFIQKLLFKRFDSSIAAFKSTLQKIIKAHDIMLQMLQDENGKVKIPKEYHNLDRFYELIESDSDDSLESLHKLEEKGKIFSLEVSDFDKEYAQALQADKQALSNLLQRWEAITQDPKLEALQKFLASLEIGQKVVIFTEAKSSSEYLTTKLEATPSLSSAILHIHGGNRDELESSIRENFDANYPKDKQQDEKRIIITTDVLAEGINLHRANIIINYDTPYNSTRLMQRIGRINRIGTPHKQIHICNFKPDYFTDSIIHIRAIASQKIQSFHYTLGEDSAIYDESEEFDSKKLFDESIKTQKEDLSKETLHKKALKDLYHSDKQAFQKIQSLPNKSRCFIQTKDQALSYAYLKSTHKGSNIFAPYCIQETSDNLLREEKARECSVFDMLDFLQKHIDYPKHPASKSQLSVHYRQINKAIEAFTTPSQAPLAESSSSDKHASKAIGKLQAYIAQPAKDPQEAASLQALLHAIKQGSHANLSQKIINAKDKDEILAIATDAHITQRPSSTKPSRDIKSLDIELSLSTFIKSHKE